MQLLSPCSPAQDPARSARTREHLGGDLPTQHMARVKEKNIKMQKITFSTCYVITCIRLGFAHMCARI